MPGLDAREPDAFERESGGKVRLCRGGDHTRHAPGAREVHECRGRLSRERMPTRRGRERVPDLDVSRTRSAIEVDPADD